MNLASQPSVSCSPRVVCRPGSSWRVLAIVWNTISLSMVIFSFEYGARWWEHHLLPVTPISPLVGGRNHVSGGTIRLPPVLSLWQYHRHLGWHSLLVEPIVQYCNDNTIGLSFTHVCDPAELIFLDLELGHTNGKLFPRHISKPSWTTPTCITIVAITWGGSTTSLKDNLADYFSQDQILWKKVLTPP